MGLTHRGSILLVYMVGSIVQYVMSREQNEMYHFLYRILECIVQYTLKYLDILVYSEIFVY